MTAPIDSPYTYLERELTLRLLAQGWRPDDIVNEIESLRVNLVGDEAAMQAAKDRVRERLMDEEMML